MRNKLYFVLFPLYVIVVAFILYVNGVFSGQISSLENLAINAVFLAVIGILFIISMFSFGRLNRCTDELADIAEVFQKEYQDAGGKNLWEKYQDTSEVFDEKPLSEAFRRYQLRMRRFLNRRGYVATCDLEEYINEDLLDRVGKTYFNSGISGTLTGLGILGTFLGLALGLGSFQGDDIYTISDNVGPLLMGMKVAFHTSVYGIFFSLVFNFVYRSIMSDAYEKLNVFLDVFHRCVQPVVTADGDDAAMLIYQANTANYLKRLLELVRGIDQEQTAGVERIVDQFMERLGTVMGNDFQKLGRSLNDAVEVQSIYVEQCRQLAESMKGTVEANQAVLEKLEELTRRQELFAKELLSQKECVAAACEEIENQLYTFEQMRSLYEKQ